MKTKTFTLLALALCSYLPAIAYAPPMKPQTEFEQLAVVFAKYGNNPRGIPALQYAVLQNDIEAVPPLKKKNANN